MQDRALIRKTINNTLEYFSNQGELVYIPPEVVQSAQNPQVKAMLDVLTPDGKPFIKDYYPNPNIDAWVICFADEKEASIACLWDLHWECIFIKIEVAKGHQNDQWIRQLIDCIKDAVQQYDTVRLSIDIAVIECC